MKNKMLDEESFEILFGDTIDESVMFIRPSMGEMTSSIGWRCESPIASTNYGWKQLTLSIVVHVEWMLSPRIWWIPFELSTQKRTANDKDTHNEFAQEKRNSICLRWNWCDVCVFSLLLIRSVGRSFFHCFIYQLCMNTYVVTRARERAREKKLNTNVSIGYVTDLLRFAKVFTSIWLFVDDNVRFGVFISPLVLIEWHKCCVVFQMQSGSRKLTMNKNAKIIAMTLFNSKSRWINLSNDSQTHTSKQTKTEIESQTRRTEENEKKTCLRIQSKNRAIADPVQYLFLSLAAFKSAHADLIFFVQRHSTSAVLV